MKHLLLECGKPYPLPLATREGASAQFLMRQSSILQVVIPGMDTLEEWALTRGNLKAGVLSGGGACLLLFQFHGRDMRPILTFDCPFDIRILPEDARVLPNTETAESRFVFEVHAIAVGASLPLTCAERCILRGLRPVTMPPDMTREFFSAVQDQLASHASGEVRLQEWMRLEPVELVKRITMRHCGK
jgi:hypothetical protein